MGRVKLVSALPWRENVHEYERFRQAKRAE